MDRGAAKNQTVYGATKNQIQPSTYMYILQIDQRELLKEYSPSTDLRWKSMIIGRR